MSDAPLDLDAIRACAEAATDGPWYHGGDTRVAQEMFQNHELIISPMYPLVEFADNEQGAADAEFAARARTDVPALLAHIDLLNSTLHAVLRGAAEDYRQCIVAARASGDPNYYEKCNGRAEAYRQAATHLAEKTGLPVPDWDRIRREVPADGVYRSSLPTSRHTATPGVCANRMYASIGGRCCAHCGQQIHHDGNDWRHIATKQAACAMEREAVADPDAKEDAERRKRDLDELDRLHGGAA